MPRVYRRRRPEVAHTVFRHRRQRWCVFTLLFSHNHVCFFSLLDVVVVAVLRPPASRLPPRFSSAGRRPAAVCDSSTSRVRKMLFLCIIVTRLLLFSLFFLLYFCNSFSQFAPQFPTFHFLPTTFNPVSFAQILFLLLFLPLLSVPSAPSAD